MRWTSIFGTLLALASLGLVARVALRTSTPDPAALHAAATAELERGAEGDLSRMAVQVDRLLASPSVVMSPEQEQELALDSARLYRAMGSRALALERYQRRRLSLGAATAAATLEEAELLLELARFEEAWLLADGVASGAEAAAALTLRGRVEQAQGQRALSTAGTIIQTVLSGDSARVALDAARAVAMRELEDPSRNFWISELERSFDAARERSALVEVIGSLEEASELFEQGRQTFGLALEQGFAAGALTGLLELLDGAGQYLMAAELAIAMRPRLLEELDEEALLATLNSLERAGQGARALALIDDLPLDGERAVSLEVLRAACATAFRFLNDEQPELSAYRILPRVAASLRLRGTNIDARQAGWYAGMALLLRPTNDAAERLSLVDRGLRNLEPYLASNRPEPLPQATAMALDTAASAYREKGANEAELGALLELTGQDPSYSGEAWLRLSKLQEVQRNAGFRVPEESLTKAMSLLPGKAWDQVEHWKDLGRLSLRAESRSVKSMEQALDNQAANLRDYSPASRYLLAEQLLATAPNAERTGLALGVARRLRQDYPGLVPALDLELECLFNAGMRRQAAQVLLERLDLTGPDARFRAFVDRFGVWSLTDPQYATLVTQDPAGEGRLAVAERALLDGTPDVALLALGTDRRPADDAPEHDLLRADALIQLGRPVPASRAAALALGSARTRGRAWLRLVQARLAGDSTNLDVTLDVFLDQPSEVLAEAPLEEIVDALLGASRAQAALRVARRLDEAPETRSPELLQRLGLCAALLGDRDLLETTLDRWEAFRGDGVVELLRVTLALEDQDWRALPALSGPLANTPLAATDPWVGFLADICREQPERALEVAEAQVKAQPSSTDWNLSLGLVQALLGLPLDLPATLGPKAEAELTTFLAGKGEPLDPRFVLRLIAASRVKGWGLWSLPRVASLASDPPGLWELLLAEQAQAGLGQTALASEVRTLLSARFPKCAPVWLRREAAAVREAEGDTWAPAVQELRAARLAACGLAPTGDSARDTVDRALLAVASGREAGAVQLLTKALAEDGGQDLHEAAWLLGRLHLREGQPLKALGRLLPTWQALFPEGEARPVGGHPRSLELLQALEAARTARGSALAGEDAQQILQDLVERVPHDPWIALAQVRTLLRIDPRNRDLVTTRARTRLVELRQRINEDHRQRNREQDSFLLELPTFEEVAPGAGHAWAEWLSGVSPQLAIQFLGTELVLDPGDGEAWLLRARAASDLGDLTAAQQDLAFLEAAAGSREAALRASVLLASRGPRPVVLRERFARLSEVAPFGEYEGAVVEFSLGWAEAQQAVGRGARALRNARTVWHILANGEAGPVAPEVFAAATLGAAATAGEPGDLKWLEQASADLLRRRPSAYVVPLTRALRGLTLDAADA